MVVGSRRARNLKKSRHVMGADSHVLDFTVEQSLVQNIFVQFFLFFVCRLLFFFFVCKMVNFYFYFLLIGQFQSFSYFHSALYNLVLCTMLKCGMNNIHSDSRSKNIVLFFPNSFLYKSRNPIWYQSEFSAFDFLGQETPSLSTILCVWKSIFAYLFSKTPMRFRQKRISPTQAPLRISFILRLFFSILSSSLHHFKDGRGSIDNDTSYALEGFFFVESPRQVCVSPPIMRFVSSSSSFQ